MASPFDIEELYPDVAGGPVRLPRRQSGGSPQGLTVTLLADYTLRTRVWLPSAALVALLAEAGVNTAGARTAISRLARRGVLEIDRQGRRSSYRLTQPAVDNLWQGGCQIAAFPTEAESWDGRWTLVAFSLPQQAVAERRALRGQLRWLGCAPLYDGLWVSPRDLGDAARGELADLALGSISVFRARHVDVAAATNRVPIEAWDTTTLAGDYDSFIRRWSPLLPRIGCGALTGAAAVRARTEVMDAYRRFPTLDPLLPLRLMPAAWPRTQAHAIFVAVYDGLAALAQAHVHTVVDRCVGGMPSGVRAHTMAAIMAILEAKPAGQVPTV